MANEMHCVTVSEWKSVHKRLDDLENIVKEFKSKLFGNEDQELNSNLETQDSVETESVELNSQPNLISAGPDNLVITLPGPSAIDQHQLIQESLTLTSEVDITEVKSPSTSSNILANTGAIASTSIIVNGKDVHARAGAPSASSSSSCFPSGIGIQDQNAFEKSRRAVISLKRCDETEDLAGKRSFGSKKKENTKHGSTTNTIKRTRRPNVPRKPAGSSSNEKRSGKSKGSAVPAAVKQKRYKCLICSMKFTTKTMLLSHMRVHKGERPYSCHVCAKRFSQKCGLRVHLRIHTGKKPHACQVCLKTFRTSAQLKRHSRVHTGEKPFQCQFCSKWLSEKSKLISHMLIHTGEKPYNCQYCPKTFRQRTNLNLHLRTHTGEKPYTCHFCKMSFSSYSAFRYHLTRHTAGE